MICTARMGRVWTLGVQLSSCRNLPALLLYFLLPFVVAPPLAAAAIHWTGAGGTGVWSDATNWDLSVVPTSLDDAFITLPGSYSVVLDESASAQSLTMGAASGEQTLELNHRTLIVHAASSLGPSTVLSMGSGSDLSLFGDLTLAGRWLWSGGTKRGSNTLVLTGVAELDGATMKLEQGELLNLGEIRWQSGELLIREGAKLDNQRLFDIQGDLDLTAADLPGTVLNSGLLRKSAGDGTSTHAVHVENQPGGVIEVTSGSLAYVGNLTNPADAVLAGTGTLDLSGAAFIHSGTFSPGSPGFLGSQVASVGRLDYIGIYDQMEPTSVLEVDLAGLEPGSTHDLLAVDGVGMLGGTLDVRLEPNYAPAVGDRFTVLTCSESCNGDFPTVVEPSGVTFDVQVNANDVTLTTQGVFAVTASGSCPNALQFAVSGATPNSTIAIVSAEALGSSSLPNGACAGIELDLFAPQLQATVTTNRDGDFTVGPLALSESVCGSLLQAVDMATCEVSTVGQLPSPEL